MSVENVIIIGSGPAGLTAAIYTARANLSPILFTGSEIGGQVSITNEVENYPGFPESVSGADLAQKFQAQAEKFGTRIEVTDVTAVDFTVFPYKTSTIDKDYFSKAVIVSTGAAATRLGIPGENEFIGRGVSYCATCDGFFFRGKDVVVIGGGDSALEEALFLTKFASRVRIIHRRDQLRASRILQERANRNEKIEFIWNSIPLTVNGGNAVESITIKNTVTGVSETLKTDGVFVYIGHKPNSSLFKGSLDMDEKGYLIVNRHNQTSKPGIYAAGEIADPIYRQVITSAGEGAKAAMAVESYLSQLEDRQYTGTDRMQLG